MWCGDRQSVVKEADPDIDTSVKRIFRMSLPEWPWIIVAMLSAMVYGSQNPLFAVAFSEMVALFFEPKIQDMRDDSLFWALGFGVLAVAASTLVLVLLLAACLSWCAAHVLGVACCLCLHVTRPVCAVHVRRFRHSWPEYGATPAGDGIERDAAQGHGLPRRRRKHDGCSVDAAGFRRNARERTPP